MARIDSDNDDVVIDKSKKKKTREMKTYVFEIKLPDHNNDNISYTEFEFNWKDLVRKEEEKKIDPDIEIIEIDDDEPKKKKNTVKKPVDPEDDYDLEDDFIDDDELQVQCMWRLLNNTDFTRTILLLFAIAFHLTVLSSSSRRTSQSLKESPRPAEGSTSTLAASSTSRLCPRMTSPPHSPPPW